MSLVLPGRDLTDTFSGRFGLRLFDLEEIGLDNLCENVKEPSLPVRLFLGTVHVTTPRVPGYFAGEDVCSDPYFLPNVNEGIVSYRANPRKKHD